MASKIPFGIYDVDTEFLRTAHDTINETIPFSDYEEHGRSRKFYCGPVCEHTGVPVSSQKKDESMHRDTTYIPMKENGEIVGTLNFAYMVPVADDSLISDISNRTQIGPHAQKQINWCMSNENRIKTAAKAHYEAFAKKRTPCCMFEDYDAISDLAYEIVDERENRLEQLAAKKAQLNGATTNPAIKVETNLDETKSTENTDDTNYDS